MEKKKKKSHKALNSNIKYSTAYSGAPQTWVNKL